MDDLRRLAAEYSRVQMGIDLKNREVQAERERRKGIELEIVDLMKTPEFATVHNFQHQGAIFKVDPPEHGKVHGICQRQNFVVTLCPTGVLLITGMPKSVLITLWLRSRQDLVILTGESTGHIVRIRQKTDPFKFFGIFYKWNTIRITLKMFCLLKRMYTAS